MYDSYDVTITVLRLVRLAIYDVILTQYFFISIGKSQGLLATLNAENRTFFISLILEPKLSLFLSIVL